MNIFKLEFKSTFKGLLLWSGIVSLMLFLFMAFFPSMSNDAMKDLVSTKLSAMPISVLKALGIDSFPDFSDITQYYAYVLQYVALAAGIYAALLGTNTLIKEETYGTIEYLYAQPITRIQTTLFKFLSSVFTFILFIFSISITSSIMFFMFKPENADIVEIITQMKTILSGMILSGFVFISIGFFISTIIKSAKQATPVGIGIVFGTYILGMFSKTISDKVEIAKVLKYLSPLDFGMPFDILKNGFDPLMVVLGILIIIICVAFSFAIYNKKDFRV
jgi:ABC-2 type transport system permease protein